MEQAIVYNKLSPLFELALLFQPAEHMENITSNDDSGQWPKPFFG